MLGQRGPDRHRRAGQVRRLRSLIDSFQPAGLGVLQKGGPDLLRLPDDHAIAVLQGLIGERRGWIPPRTVFTPRAR
jgi:hypothetical protein